MKAPKTVAWPRERASAPSRMSMIEPRRKTVRRDEVLAEDQHGRDEIEGEAERGQLVGRDTVR
jgi:hypothetical protein